ncbi:uncharacterized protein LOC144436663 [Glandiceps talaboti]
MNGPWMEVTQSNIQLGTVSQNFSIKYVRVQCQRDPISREMEDIVEETTTKAVNAFEILIAGGREFVRKRVKKPSSSGVSLTKKQELYNSLVDLFEKRGLD